MCRQVLPSLTVGAAAYSSPGSMAGGIFSRFRWRANDRKHVPAPSDTVSIHESKAPSSVVLAPEDALASIATETPVLESNTMVNVVVSASPEFSETSYGKTKEFYARISVKYEGITSASPQIVPVDVVCVLDNSESMRGSKLESLKKAMEFVIQTLGPNDRLSIVNFNTTATPLHGLLKMNSVNQDTAKAAVHALKAVGCTDIYDGMITGWTILDNRKTKNPASCMFLLTDGQDLDNLDEKLYLARKMKSAGTSLFVFGFGTDHDSEHMVRI